MGPAARSYRGRRQREGDVQRSEEAVARGMRRGVGSYQKLRLARGAAVGGPPVDETEWRPGIKNGAFFA